MLIDRDAGAESADTIVQSLNAAPPPAACVPSPALSTTPREGRAAAFFRRRWPNAFEAPSPDATMWCALGALAALLIAGFAGAHVLVLFASVFTLGMSVAPAFVSANRELAAYHSNRPPPPSEGQGAYALLLADTWSQLRAENAQSEQTVRPHRRAS